MGLGKHLVIYQAADEAKNKEKCVFTITVVQFKQEHPGRKYVVLSNLIAGNKLASLGYASPKLRLTYRLTYLLTGVKCRATSVAKN